MGRFSIWAWETRSRSKGELSFFKLLENSFGQGGIKIQGYSDLALSAAGISFRFLACYRDRPSHRRAGFGNNDFPSLFHLARSVIQKLELNLSK